LVENYISMAEKQYDRAELSLSQEELGLRTFQGLLEVFEHRFKNSHCS